MKFTAPPSLKSENHIQGEIRSLSRSYRVALEKHLAGNSDTIPDPALTHKLGTRTLNLGVDLLGLTRIHENALAALVENGLSARAQDKRAQRCSAFFYSALLPIEESRFNASEANNQLKASIKTLTQRTGDLDRSNKKLLAEISRREDVEKSLRTSEATTSLLLKQAHEMQEQMRSLSRRLITAQENERRRISRELHDVIAQTLAGINVRLAVLRSESAANAEGFHEKIEITEQLVEQSVEIVHRFASDLRPAVLDDIGLIPALKTYLHSFTEHYGIPVKLVASPAVEELANSALTALFRIAQEALTNITRHSRASLVKLDIRPAGNSFRMKISDDGQGFTTNREIPIYENRLGILGMRERAEMEGGSFQIDSVVGEGTVIRVTIPRDASVPAKRNKSKSNSPKNAKKTK